MAVSTLAAYNPIRIGRHAAAMRLAGMGHSRQEVSYMKTTVFVGASLDGFIARQDGALDFLHASGAEKDNGYDEFFATVDALIIGRHTYDVVLAFPAWPYGQKPVYVLSTRPLSPPPLGACVEHMSGSPAEVLLAVASHGFHHVYVDGGLTIQHFLREGLIQRIVVTRVPVLIGTGIPLFGPIGADIPLRHIATRVLSGGAVQSDYSVLTARAIDAKPQSDISVT